jgi:hypothetical protein
MNHHVNCFALFWTTIRPGYNCQSSRNTKLSYAYRQCYVIIFNNFLFLLVCIVLKKLNILKCRTPCKTAKVSNLQLVFYIYTIYIFNFFLHAYPSYPRALSFHSSMNEVLVTHTDVAQFKRGQVCDIWHAPYSIFVCKNRTLWLSSITTKKHSYYHKIFRLKTWQFDVAQQNNKALISFHVLDIVLAV